MVKKKNKSPSKKEEVTED